MAERSAAVHMVGNISDTDRFGRLTRFRIQALCGLKLQPDLRLTDRRRQVTCQNCQKTIALWRGH